MIEIDRVTGTRNKSFAAALAVPYEKLTSVYIREVHTVFRLWYLLLDKY